MFRPTCGPGDGRKLPHARATFPGSGSGLITTNALAQRDELLIDLILLLGPTSTSEPLPLRARVVWCTPIRRPSKSAPCSRSSANRASRFLDMFCAISTAASCPRGPNSNPGASSESGVQNRPEPTPEVTTIHPALTLLNVINQWNLRHPDLPLALSVQRLAGIGAPVPAEYPIDLG